MGRVVEQRPCITIQKKTNGADANDPNGADVPNIVPGGSVTWTYEVTNCGNVSVPKANVVVTDNQPGVTPVFESELFGNGDNSFDPGEIWLYKATGVALNLLLPPPQGVTTQQGVCTHNGQEPPRTAYVNTGTVTVPGAQASDPSSYCNPPAPNITIIKYTNGADANNPDGADVPNILPGGVVTWTYKVTNTGNVSVPKANVVVTDNQPTVTPVFDSELFGNGDNSFDPGEIWLYKATGVALNLLLPPPAGVTTQQGVCTHNGQEPPRTAYVNTGTVTIPGAQAFDPSSYCNPPAASLGDFVWEDLNANGIQDAGEPGIPGVTVHLMDCANNILATTNTNAAGLYLFSGLMPGNYNVHFVLPAGYSFSPQDQGVDDTKDSDANPATGMTVCTTLVAGENDLTWDAGMYQKASLGDFVWEDLNANGIQDAGEPGIPGVTVHLMDCANNILATTNTNAVGLYLFSGLTPGNYNVQFVLPAGYSFSPQDQGGDDTKDSDANPANGMTVCTTLVSGENDLTWDAGMFKTLDCNLKVNKTCAIAEKPKSFDCNSAKPIDKVYLKLGGSKKISSYKVYYGSSASSSKLCDQGGTVNVGDPFTLQCTNSSLQSSFNNSDYVYAEFKFSDGTSGKSLFAKHSDLDMDGQEDCGKMEGNGTSTSTSYYNKWSFDGMHGSKGDELKCSSPPPPAPFPTGESCEASGTSDIIYGYTVTNFGDTVLVSSVMDDKLGQINVGSFTLLPGESKQFTKTATISTTTTNVVTVTSTLANGQQCTATDELTVKIFANCVYTQGYWKTHTKYGPAGPRDAAWDLVTLSGEDSMFFDTGKTWYQAFWTNPAGNAYWILAHQYMAAYLNMLNGADVSAIQVALNHAKDLLDTYDTDMGAITGAVKDDFITTAYFLDEYNNGKIGPPHCDDKEPMAKIGDFVWNDADKDGIQDSGESGVKGIIVKLFDCADNFVAQTTTDTYGKYSFTVLPGNYYVQFILPSGYNFTLKDQGSNDGKDSDADTTTGKTVCTSLSPGETDLTWDAGIYKPNKATIGDRVWKDIDKDGIQDSGESGIKDVAVTLYDCTDNFVATTTTNSNGYYYFTVAPGSYYVKFTLPLGYAFSPKDKGSDDTKDSDADTTTGNTVCVTLVSSQTDLKWDAGMYEVKSACTYTQGYWKTHSKYGPARYDDAWSKVPSNGEDTMFFGTQKSWYDSLWYSPSGNAYWILAHQYEAAYLNGLNGADLTVVNSTMIHAYDLLNTYANNMGAITGAVKDDFVNTAYELDRYNNGLIGPGHCADEKPLTCE